MRLIIGISGASGEIIAVKLLLKLKTYEEVETHLIVTEGAALTFEHETDFDLHEVKQLADKVYDVNEMDASIASGSFLTEGMIIVPCSMKTVAGLASGYAENLLLRAADVCIKERRKLIIVPREMPLSRIHLKNMLELSNDGVIIIPPMMTFYNVPSTIEEQIDHIVNKILMQFNLKTDIKEWQKNNP